MNTEDFVSANEELRRIKILNADIDEAIYRIEHDDLRSVTRLQDEWTAAQAQDINNAVDPDTQKPLFSNAERRTGEMLIRQAGDKAYQDREDQLDALRTQIAGKRFDQARNSIEIKFLVNDIEYALTHAADAVDNEIRQLRTTLETATNTAAARAVREAFAALLHADN